MEKIEKIIKVGIKMENFDDLLNDLEENVETVETVETVEVKKEINIDDLLEQDFEDLLDAIDEEAEEEAKKFDDVPGVTKEKELDLDELTEEVSQEVDTLVNEKITELEQTIQGLREELQQTKSSDPISDLENQWKEKEKEVWEKNFEAQYGELQKTFNKEYRSYKHQVTAINDAWKEKQEELKDDGLNVKMAKQAFNEEINNIKRDSDDDQALDAYKRMYEYDKNESDEMAIFSQM